MDCTSPFPPLTSSSHKSQMPKDHVLNPSPRPSSYLKPIAHLATTFLDKTSNSWDSEKEHTIDSNASFQSDGRTTCKSSAELVEEIAKIEVDIVHLERHLLSLYRTAFQQHLPMILGENVEQMTETSPRVSSGQPSQKMKLGLSRDCDNNQGQGSPKSSLAGPSNLVQVASPNSSSRMAEQSAYLRHHSLADHLRNSRIDDALIHPDRLSEDIIRCISSIYCKFVPSNKGFSSTSSFCSSSTFSPGDLSGSWSPLCNDEVTENSDIESLKQDNGPSPTMVEVLKICLDDESYSYAATMLQKFRSLVKSLEIVNPMKMKREEKLAFWINIHNALLMHAYLAYGTQNCMRSTCVMKAAYNVGGHCINAYEIQNSILGIISHYSARTIVSPVKKFKIGNTTHPYAIEYPEPLVHFALCSGSYSDPAVRVYTAKNVFEDLKVAKEEFVQATVYVHKETKVYMPKMLCYYGKDMSLGVAALLDAVSECLSPIQQKAISTCVKGRPEKCVHWLDRSSSFRYLIHKETCARS